MLRDEEEICRRMNRHADRVANTGREARARREALLLGSRVELPDAGARRQLAARILTPPSQIFDAEPTPMNMLPLASTAMLRLLCPPVGKPVTSVSGALAGASVP